MVEYESERGGDAGFSMRAGYRDTEALVEEMTQGFWIAQDRYLLSAKLEDLGIRDRVHQVRVRDERPVDFPHRPIRANGPMARECVYYIIPRKPFEVGDTGAFQYGIGEEPIFGVGAGYFESLSLEDLRESGHAGTLDAYNVDIPPATYDFSDF